MLVLFLVFSYQLLYRTSDSKMNIPALFKYFPAVILLAAATSEASVISFSTSPNVSKRNNINKYYSCSTTQQNFINQAYKDALKLADNVSPFLPVRDELFAPGQGPGPLEIRYFGADIAPSNDAKPVLIRSRSSRGWTFSIYTNIKLSSRH